MPRQTIIALEAGKYAPSLPLAFRIAKVFGVTIEEVFQHACPADNDGQNEKQTKPGSDPAEDDGRKLQ